MITDGDGGEFFPTFPFSAHIWSDGNKLAKYVERLSLQFELMGVNPTTASATVTASVFREMLTPNLLTNF